MQLALGLVAALVDLLRVEVDAVQGRALVDDQRRQVLEDPVQPRFRGTLRCNVILHHYEL